MDRKEEEYEMLKKHYILETSMLLKTLEELQIDEVRKSNTKARIALLQSESATSFMELCRCILSFE